MAVDFTPGMEHPMSYDGGVVGRLQKLEREARGKGEVTVHGAIFTDTLAEIDRLQAALDGAVEALTPFASEWPKWSEYRDDLNLDRIGAYVSLANIRCAAEALSHLSPSKGEAK